MRLLAFILMLFAVGAQAASPTFQQFNANQFDTTGNRVAVERGALLTNVVFYNNGVGTAAFGTPLYHFQQPDSQTFWLSNSSIGLIWSWDNTVPIFRFNQGDVSFPDGVYIGGVRRTTWPSGGSGSQTPWLSDIDGSAFGLTNTSRIFITNVNPAVAFMTLSPSADPQERGRGGLLWSVQYFTNPGGDSNDNKVFINGGFNSGVGGTQVDGREPTFAPVWETWWNGAGVEPEGHQMEIYDLYRSPSNAITVRPRGLVLRGTNTIQHTVNGSQWVFNGFRSPHAEDQLLISDGAPTTTNGGVSIIASGVLTTHTNASNNGGIEIEGGTFKIGGPDSVSANNMFFRTDWNNGFAMAPHSVIYPSGVQKALYFGHPTLGANGFTNYVFTTNVLAFNGVQASNGFKSSIGLFTKMPTNTPAIHQVLAASDTLGNTHWTNPPSGGGGGSNGLSYVNGTDPQYKAIEVVAMHRLNMWFTNNFVALGVTNAGGNSWVSINNYSDGAEIARFAGGSGGFIDMGSYELRTEGDAAIQITPTGMALLDSTTETPVMSIGNVGVPQTLMQEWWHLTGHMDTTNGTLTISPLLGSTDGGAAPAGTWSERATNTLASGSAVSLTTATPANVLSLTLTAGDWDVYATACFNPAATTVTTYFKAGLSTTSATLPTGPGDIASLPFAVAVNDEDVCLVVPSRPLTVTSTTTIYLVAQGGFSVSTETAYGSIRAKRAR